MNVNDEWKDCKHLFSNGMEFEFFLEDQCAKCKRYRNDHCRVLNRIYKAMFIKEEFPYEDLLDHEKYANKRCKHRTIENITRKKTTKQIVGQISLFEKVGDE